jgi:hypothetical protein
MAQGGFNDPKIRLHKELEQLELSSQDGRWSVYMTSFIISTSLYADLQRAFGTGNYKKHEFYLEHVLFQEDSDYIQRLLDQLLSLPGRSV